jgi:hypothetical protein
VNAFSSQRGEGEEGEAAPEGTYTVLGNFLAIFSLSPAGPAFLEISVATAAMALSVRFE